MYVAGKVPSQTAKAQRLSIDSFLAQVKKYAVIKEPDAEIIRILVERIDVFKTEKVPDTRTKNRPSS
ncbi:MAG: DUF4368 domain-containing protein [Lachnospiraceae bacterium]|nr:DUF4368 domain-containing protein [Lachnospiraceae bacterium]